MTARRPRSGLREPELAVEVEQTFTQAHCFPKRGRHFFCFLGAGPHLTASRRAIAIANAIETSPLVAHHDVEGGVLGALRDIDTDPQAVLGAE